MVGDILGTGIDALTGDVAALLLLAVFTLVNIAVLVLRRDKVRAQHFVAPTWAPVLGIVLCGFLATPLSGRPGVQFLVAGALLAVGVLFWLVNRLIVVRVNFDPAHPDKE